MKQNLTFFLILLFGTFSYSQSIKINWEGSTVIDYGSSKVTVPFFKNDSFAYEEGGVHLRMVEKYAVF